jgi:hypothetical protein
MPQGTVILLPHLGNEIGVPAGVLSARSGHSGSSDPETSLVRTGTYAPTLGLV